MTLFRAVTMWSMVSMAGVAQVLETVPLRTARDRADYGRVQRCLDATTLSADWTTRSLADALAELRRATRLNWIVDRAVDDRVDAPLKFEFHDLRARSVLALLRDRAGVTFLYDEGVIHVTTHAEAVRRASVLALHEVADILYTPPDFPARRDVGIPIGTPDEPESSERGSMDPEFLIDLIRQSTGGEEAWEMEGVSITVHKSRIVVRHTPAMQKKVACWLDSLR